MSSIASYDILHRFEFYTSDYIECQMIYSFLGLLPESRENLQ